MPVKPAEPKLSTYGTTPDGRHFVALVTPDFGNEPGRFREKIVRFQYRIATDFNDPQQPVKVKIVRVKVIADEKPGKLNKKVIVDQDIPSGLYVYVCRTHFKDAQPGSKPTKETSVKSIVVQL